MTTPRSQLVDANIPMHYHLVSRCVRSSWLCGRDRHSGKNYDHRKNWIKQRLFHLASYFAIEVDAYALMSNHFHLVVRYDPTAARHWSDQEVAQRWSDAFPSKAVKDSEEPDLLKALQQEQLTSDPKKLARARRTLGSLSDFMKHLKQPIAWRANREDGCTGHFFEGRFYSGALLDEQAVLASMAYVDLNPVRAKIAQTLKNCRDSSIADRLGNIANTPERLLEAIKPLVSGLSDTAQAFTVSLESYITHLNRLMNPNDESNVQRRWLSDVAALKKRQRAYGSIQQLKDWMARHGWKRLGIPLSCVVDSV